MRLGAWLLGSGATLLLVGALIAIVVLDGGGPFDPGPLSADRAEGRTVSDFGSHADFESRCELCHTPFKGPDFSRCIECHIDVGDQMKSAQGLHGRLPNPQECTVCHPDHKGRTAKLTSASLADLPHNQFGYTLARHQRDYSGAALTCRSCHTSTTTALGDDSAAVLAACIDCHKVEDARFIADHRVKMGEACLACHDGTNRLQGFDHAVAYALDGNHATVTCAKCHVQDRYRGTPRECVQCHPDPQVHRGQFGTDCESCHTTAGWRPARLVKHRFPLDHGGKESACRVCHPTVYASNTCYGCHDHTPANVTPPHLKEGIADFHDCIRCHPTGKERE